VVADDVFMELRMWPNLLHVRVVDAAENLHEPHAPLAAPAGENALAAERADLRAAIFDSHRIDFLIRWRPKCVASTAGRRDHRVKKDARSHCCDATRPGLNVPPAADYRRSAVLRLDTGVLRWVVESGCRDWVRLGEPLEVA
jgi:hypothetical protein